MCFSSAKRTFVKYWKFGQLGSAGQAGQCATEHMPVMSPRRGNQTLTEALRHFYAMSGRLANITDC